MNQEKLLQIMCDVFLTGMAERGIFVNGYIDNPDKEFKEFENLAKIALSEAFEMGRDSVPKPIREKLSNEELDARELKWRLENDIIGKNNLLYRFLESSFENLILFDMVISDNDPFQQEIQAKIDRLVNCARYAAEKAYNLRFKLTDF